MQFAAQVSTADRANPPPKRCRQCHVIWCGQSVQQCNTPSGLPHAGGCGDAAEAPPHHHHHPSRVPPPPVSHKRSAPQPMGPPYPVEAYQPVKEQAVGPPRAGGCRNAAEVPEQPHYNRLGHIEAQLRRDAAIAAACADLREHLRQSMAQNVDGSSTLNNRKGRPCSKARQAAMVLCAPQQSAHPLHMCRFLHLLLNLKQGA
jgi:hypothetical protein